MEFLLLFILIYYFLLSLSAKIETESRVKAHVGSCREMYGV